MLKRVIKRLVPPALAALVFPRLRKILHPIYWGNLRRTSPVSISYGYDRGQPVDRYYIDHFLQKHCLDISGDILEIGDPRYTIQFGGDRVTKSAVLYPVAGNPQATVVADLEIAGSLPQNAYDCIIATQTLLFIYDVPNAIRNCYNALKPGGVLLVTIPGISQIIRNDMNLWGEYWRFTDASSQRLFGSIFGNDNVVVETYGNVLAACASLHGMASSDLKSAELDVCDPDYQVTIAVRAQKSDQLVSGA